MDGTIVLVLVYVADNLCVTDKKSVKAELFAKLALPYSIKDQGELTEYIGVEVQASADAVSITQRKYARDILKKFNLEQARAVGYPQETKQKLVGTEGNEEIDETFDFCGAAGMLMLR